MVVLSVSFALLLNLIIKCSKYILMANSKKKVELSSVSNNNAKLPVICSPVMSMTIDELVEAERSINAEIDALDEQIRSVQKELFYRRNPECRPKDCI